MRERRGPVVLAAVVAHGQRHPMLDDVGDFLPRRDQLENASVDFPVAQLRGAQRVVSEVDDVQPVGQVIEHHAAFATEDADGARLVQHLYLSTVDVLAPVPGRWLEPELFRRRAGSEEHDVRLVRTNPGFVRCSLKTGQDSISHPQLPSAGRSHTCPSYRAMKSSLPAMIR
jgi:hypothetical protein